MRLSKMVEQFIAALGRITPAFAPVPNEFPRRRRAATKTVSDSREARKLSIERVADALDFLEIRYLADHDENLLAMWERHVVLFTVEGDDKDILVSRMRANATVAPKARNRALHIVNEWNHTRRFMKAYVGDPTERGQLPIYGEMQTPLMAGVHDALLIELVDAAAAIATTLVEFLYSEGAFPDGFSARGWSSDAAGDG